MPSRSSRPPCLFFDGETEAQTWWQCKSLEPRLQQTHMPSTGASTSAQVQQRWV